MSRVRSAPAVGTLPPNLVELARRVGVEAEYVDGFGTRRSPSVEALLAVLRSLGVPAHSLADVDPVLAEHARTGALPPVVVAWDGQLPSLELRAPSGTGIVRCQIALESGETRTWDADVDGEGRVTIVHPEPLPLGGHTLEAEARSWRVESHVVSAPSSAYAPGARRRGVFVPLYALHSRLSWGAGNFGDLGELSAWVSGIGGNLVGTLPLLAAFLDDPCEPSPYSPVSRLFWNELYVEVEAVPDVESSERARERLAAASDEIASLRGQRSVDHARQARLAREVLTAALADMTPERRKAFERFVDAHPDVREYARFRAAGERHGRDWRRWPVVDGDPEAVDYHCYVQWIAGTQVERLSRTMRSHGVELFLDLPLGSHPDGYDRWRHATSFAEGVSAGAPPDAFFSEGQDWGLAPLDPAGSAASGHEYFRRCLAFQMAVADVLRIDHVMGLHRTFWIPRGFEPRDGVYVRNPAQELFALVCLESQRARCRVVGEDLGTVPAEVRDEMARRDLARTIVVQFEIPADPDARPAVPPPHSLATLNTHDTPPFARFWDGGDVDDRVRMGLLDEHEAEEEHAARARQREAAAAFLAEEGLASSSAPGDVLRGLLAWLGRGPAESALANLEDLWLEREPQNVPGTTEHNWCRRTPEPLEEWTGRREVQERLLALVRPDGGDLT